MADGRIEIKSIKICPQEAPSNSQMATGLRPAWRRTRQDPRDCHRSLCGMKRWATWSCHYRKIKTNQGLTKNQHVHSLDKMWLNGTKELDRT